jgi:hypothetical protein
LGNLHHHGASKRAGDQQDTDLERFHACFLKPK